MLKKIDINQTNFKKIVDHQNLIGVNVDNMP
jgi:hypothetical protein